MNYTKEHVAPYIEGLIEIIPDKIREIMAKMDEVISRKEELLSALRVVKQREGEDAMRDYLVANLAEFEFIEYYRLKNELTKWIALLELCVPEEANRETERSEKTVSMFSKEELEKANRSPLSELYQGRLRSIGSRFTGRCPFHTEKTPSFFIFENTNTFHCFGCGKHGDAIDFVMNTRNITFREAVEALL